MTTDLLFHDDKNEEENSNNGYCHAGQTKTKTTPTPTVKGNSSSILSGMVQSSVDNLVFQQQSQNNSSCKRQNQNQSQSQNINNSHNSRRDDDRRINFALNGRIKKFRITKNKHFMIMERIEAFFYNHGMEIALFVIYISLNLLVGSYGAYQFTKLNDGFTIVTTDNDNDNINNILLKYTLPIARVGGRLVSLNCSILLLTACKYIWTKIREYVVPIIPLGFPIDNIMPKYHRIVALFIIVAGCIIHTIPQIINYSTKNIILENKFRFWTLSGNNNNENENENENDFATTQLLITGTILLIIFFTFFITTLPSFRKTAAGFRWFWFFHMTGITLVYPILIIHGTCYGHPYFLYFALLPMIIYLFDIVIRQSKITTTNITKMKIHNENDISTTDDNNNNTSSSSNRGQRITELVIECPPNFCYTPGQYAELLFPPISKYEWHPFTIVGCDDDYDYEDDDDYDEGKNGKNKNKSKINGNGNIDGNGNGNGNGINIDGNIDSNIDGNGNGNGNGNDDINNNNDNTNSNKNKKKIMFYIKSSGRWTEALYTYAANNNNNNNVTQISIRGPHGAPAMNYFEYKHIIVIGSGVGCTPLLAIWKYLVQRSRIMNNMMMMTNLRNNNNEKEEETTTNSNNNNNNNNNNIISNDIKIDDSQQLLVDKDDEDDVGGEIIQSSPENVRVKFNSLDDFVSTPSFDLGEDSDDDDNESIDAPRNSFKESVTRSSSIVSLQNQNISTIRSSCIVLMIVLGSLTTSMCLFCLFVLGETTARIMQLFGYGRESNILATVLSLIALIAHGSIVVVSVLAVGAGTYIRLFKCWLEFSIIISDSIALWFCIKVILDEDDDETANKFYFIFFGIVIVLHAVWIFHIFYTTLKPPKDDNYKYTSLSKKDHNEQLCSIQGIMINRYYSGLIFAAKSLLPPTRTEDSLSRLFSMEFYGTREKEKEENTNDEESLIYKTLGSDLTSSSFRQHNRDYYFYQGRPNWQLIFLKAIAKAHATHPIGKSSVGIFFCGSPAIAADLQTFAAEITAQHQFSKKMLYGKACTCKLIVHSENF